jgi:hypothetical protein
MTAPTFIEYDTDKIERVPVVQDTAHPDHTDDPDGATGALVALDGPPVSGGVPTYDTGTGKHTSQVPGALGGMVPTFIAPDETFTIPANRQALYAMDIDNEGTLDIEGFLIQVD